MSIVPRFRRYRSMHDQLIDPRWPERAWTFQWLGYSLSLAPLADAGSRASRRLLRLGFIAAALATLLALA